MLSIKIERISPPAFPVIFIDLVFPLVGGLVTVELSEIGNGPRQQLSERIFPANLPRWPVGRKIGGVHHQSLPSRYPAEIFGLCTLAEATRMIMLFILPALVATSIDSGSDAEHPGRCSITRSCNFLWCWFCVHPAIAG